MRGLAPPVWRDSNFNKIWVGEIVSSLGSGITTLALPLIAIGALQAGASEMGILGAASTSSFIVFGLLAGVIVDRAPRRLVLAVTSCAAAAVVASIPVASSLGILDIRQLYMVAFAAGCVSVVADVAFQAILPQVVGRDRVLEGNAILRTTGAVTEIVGPGLAGVLIQVLTAPIAIVVDACSFLAAGVLALFVRTTEPPPRPRGRILSDVVEGLRFVVSTPALRAIALGGGMHNVFQNGAFAAIYILFATDRLGLSPVQLGFVLASSGPGALVGALVAARYRRLVGLRASLIQTQVVTAIARALVPAAVFLSQPVAALVVGEFVLGFARSVFNVNQVSFRQAITPDHLQGRMAASIRFLLWVLVPLGSLAGGFGAARIGITPMLCIAVGGILLAAGWFVLVPGDEKPDTAQVQGSEG